MLAYTALCLLATSGLGVAGIIGPSDPADRSAPSLRGRQASNNTQAEPCARISASLASYLSVNPSATASPNFPYDDTHDCLNSVPIVEDDATALVDVLAALLEFQSDLEFLADPPPGYLLAGVDLLGSLQKLRSSVEDGSIDNEVEFETQLATIIAQAHDGHLTFVPDGLSVFRYMRPFGPLVTVSMDGKTTPKIYLYDEMIAWIAGEADEPSAVTTINGQDAAAFVDQQQQNGTLGSFQDPDALYNHFMWAYNTGGNLMNWKGLFRGYTLTDPGPSTSMEFENGTNVDEDNYALFVGLGSWKGVVDGESFYNAFLNYSVKDDLLSASRSSASMEATATPTATGSRTATPTVIPALFAAADDDLADAEPVTATIIQGYPLPLVISDDGAASGYFLDDPEFSDTAVLVLRLMSETAQESFQSTVAEFLHQCSMMNKTRLVLDISGNPGGNIALGLDTFKQLFPDLDPYNAGNFRASDSFRMLGEIVTPLVEQQLAQNASNYTVSATSPFAATTFGNVTGQRFDDFASFYGPDDASPASYGDYTSLSRYNFSEVTFNEAFGGFVISGYANNTAIAPSPFRSSDIILLSDGRCSSTCTILAHLLKYQGKVKSIVTGGRPSSAGGPVQAIGGVKGSQVYTFQSMGSVIEQTYETLNSSTVDEWNGTVLDTLYSTGGYLTLRTASWGQSPGEVSVNMRNNIAEHDTSLTPLQFVYEAADCRMWWQPRHLGNVTNLWADVAATAFGKNGTDQWGMCTSGSTGHKSSLSGNDDLYNGGTPTNVTNGQSSSESSSDDGDSQKNAGVATIGGVSMSAVTGMVGLVAAAISFCL